MTDEPDPAVIARRYVDLWQRQLSGLAPDPSVSDAAALYLRSLMGLTAPGRTDGTVRGRRGEHRRESGSDSGGNGPGRPPAGRKRVVWGKGGARRGRPGGSRDQKK